MKQGFSRSFLLICVSLFFAGLINLAVPTESYAVGQFARTTGMSCSACHTQWPLLNETGRNFLEQGFEAGEQLTVSKHMSLLKRLPISARFNFRLLDKRTSKDKTSALTDKDKQLKIRSLHEVEVFIAGRAGEFSFFVELEAEDEWPDPAGDAPGFQVQLVKGYGGWHINPMFNLRIGYASPFGADGRNTVSRIKPGRYAWAASKQGFVPGDSQGISVYGTIENIFYTLTWHGDEDDLEGHDPKGYSARLAYDFPVASVGGFYDSTKAYDSSTGSSEDKTTKYGIDAQLIHDAFQVNAIYAKKDVDVSNAKDDLFGLFVQYIMSKDGAPMAAAAVNLDKYSKNDGVDDWTKGAVFLTYFIKENIKAQVGWEGTLEAPDAYEHKESRLTLVFDMVF